MWTSKNEPESPTAQEFSTQPGNDSAARTREELLSHVLTETLERQREDPSVLVAVIRDWRATLEDDSFCETMCQRLVGQVLGHRLGGVSQDLPQQMFEEIGAILWSNSESRLRVQRLWESIRVRQ